MENCRKVVNFVLNNGPYRNPNAPKPKTTPRNAYRDLAATASLELMREDSPYTALRKLLHKIVDTQAGGYMRLRWDAEDALEELDGEAPSVLAVDDRMGELESALVAGCDLPAYGDEWTKDDLLALLGVTTKMLREYGTTEESINAVIYR